MCCVLFCFLFVNCLGFFVFFNGVHVHLIGLLTKCAGSAPHVLFIPAENDGGEPG